MVRNICIGTTSIHRFNVMADAVVEMKTATIGEMHFIIEEKL